MNEQRRLRRDASDRPARYRLGGGSAWRECQIIDVSWDGAAIELHGVDDDEPLVGPFDLEVMSATDDGVLVGGDIRHRTRTSLGRVIIGIEFRALTVEQLQLLRLLVSARVAVSPTT